MHEWREGWDRLGRPIERQVEQSRILHLHKARNFRCRVWVDLAPQLHANNPERTLKGRQTRGTPPKECRRWGGKRRSAADRRKWYKGKSGCLRRSRKGFGNEQYRDQSPTVHGGRIEILEKHRCGENRGRGSPRQKIGELCS